MKRSLTFDVLRVLSVGFVVAVVHARQYSSTLMNCIDNAFPAWGYIVGAMAAMFFASGWLLAQKAKVENIADVLLFYKKRVVRILPLYVLSLLTFPSLAAWHVKVLSVAGLNNFIPGIGNNNSSGNLLTLWFVGVLIAFYVLLPWLLMIKSRMKSIIIGGLIEMAFIFGVYYLGWERRLAFYFPFFLGGMICSSINEKKMFWASSAIVIGYVVVRLTGCTHSEWILRPLRTFVIFDLAFILARALPFSRFWNVLAYSTFGAYLFHRQIFFLKKYLCIQGGAEILVIYLVLVPLSFGFGWLVQYCYDALLKRIEVRNT